jgi:hypothetical protein
MARLNETRLSALLTRPFGGTFMRSAATTRHAEHGASVLVGLDCGVEVYDDDSAVNGRAVLVPPDVPYAARCPGPVVTYAFDPELCPRVAAVARTHGRPRVLDGAAAAHVVGAILAHRAALWRPDVLAGIGIEAQRVLANGTARRRPPDRAARRDPARSIREPGRRGRAHAAVRGSSPGVVRARHRHPDAHLPPLAPAASRPSPTSGPSISPRLRMRPTSRTSHTSRAPAAACSATHRAVCAQTCAPVAQ